MARSQRLTVDKFTRDLTMVQSPGEWPAWPVLPVKKQTGNFTDDNYLGFLIAESKPKVYIGCMYELIGYKGQPWKDVIAKFPSVEYPDYEGLCDTWTVD